MIKVEDVFEAARTIRPLLPELLGPDAAVWDAELAGFLSRATSGEKVDNLILDLLRKDERTRNWTREFLKPNSGQDLRVYAPWPGSSNPIKPLQYRCPENDFVWYRRDAGSEIPSCPTHGLALVQSKDS